MSTSKKKNKWEGLRTIVVARQSNDKDGDASTKAQSNFMAIPLAEAGMRHVETISLEGLSGSWPARIDEIVQKLFLRKQEKDDFDVIAWQIEDRASRGGAEHGLWLQHEAKRRGLRVFFPEDLHRDTPAAFRAFKYDAAMDAAMGTGRRSAQGQNHAQKNGFFRTSGQTPFGCDRVYYGADGKPKFILHNVTNGLQEQRDFATGQVIGTYGTVGRKSYNRFRKQKNEFSLLYPGERHQRQIIRVIFYLRYKRGWRGSRIADFLNRNGVRSPKGKEWSQRQVESIYENEAYTGCTFNNQTFSGRYFRRDRDFGFVPLERDECELVMKKSFAPKLRPVDDWDRIDQPHMYDFLPHDVRDLAIAAQAQLSRQRSDPTRPKRKPNAHPASMFFLSDDLRAVQGGTLVGTMSGPADHKIPYYRHRQSKRGHRKGSVFNNLIPANALHDAVINLLADVLEDTPDLRERLLQQVVAQRAESQKDAPGIGALEAEREDLQQQIQITLRTLKGAALAAQQPELQRLGAQVNALTDRIEAGSADRAKDVRPVEVVVEDAMRVIQIERHALRSLAPEPLRNLVKRLVIDAVVDMETKTVELTVALPTWALQAPRKIFKNDVFAAKNADEALCPATSPRSPVCRWTQLPYTTVRCLYERVRGSHSVPPCYRCHRMAA